MNASDSRNDTCIKIPAQLNSKGYWASSGDYLRHLLPVLQLQMIVMFLSIEIIHFLLKRLQFPKFFSEILAGLIFGKYVLSLAKSREGQQIIDTLLMFGLTLHVFLNGVKTDLTIVKKTGKKAYAIGFSNLIVPLVLSSACTMTLTKIYPQMSNQFAVSISAMVAAQSLTSFAVIASLLSHLKIINSELGRLALSSAIVSDLCSTLLMSAVLLFYMFEKQQKGNASMTPIANICLILAVVYIVRPAMYGVIKATPQGKPVEDRYVFYIILGALAAASWTSYFRTFVLFGPYVLGLAVPVGPPLGSAVVDKLEPFVSSFFTPLFVFLCSAKAAPVLALSRLKVDQLANGAILLIGFLAKLVAVMVPSLYCKMPFEDALALALIMNGKGAVDMAFYSISKDAKLMIDIGVYTSLIIYTAVAAGALPLFARCLCNPSRKYVGYQKRNIMHMKPNAELRILACIHKSDNIAPVINLLDASCPTKDNPITVNALHLIELLGRASPLFISHQLQKGTDSETSYSEKVILAFNEFQRDNRESVTVNIFTAISQPKLMHEDICTLALNKLASLIIIPFHRKWATNGSIEWENRNVRALNSSILEMAPCSVGILIDSSRPTRSYFSVSSSQSSFSVAMLFFGGSDDREALTYAKRMVGDPSIRLMVVHFTTINDNDEDTYRKERMLDSLVLEDVKFNSMHNQNVTYKEEMVRDGPQTALIIRSMANEHDLIIVGRRHNVDAPQTSGLTEWSEFPELGVIGDLLALSNVKGKTSILVVQQQLML